MKTHIASWIVIGAALAVPAAVASEKPVTLTVYSAFEADFLNSYKTAFEAAHPHITINWVRDSIGVMTAKLLAEKNNNRADVIWGLAGSSMALLKENDILESYIPKGLQQTHTAYNDGEENPAWFGNQVAFNVVCFNTALAKARNIPEPKSWNDLTNPVYKGQISMPNPASSGTGYMQVFTWLQEMGEEQGWHYMDQLHNNISQYTHSGSKPCVQAAMGEVVVGVSLSTRASVLKKQGAPLALILPEEGIGWDPDSVGLVKNSQHPQAAKALVDWAVSAEANRIYAQASPLVNHQQVTPEYQHYPTLNSAITPLDFGTMAKQRQTILAQWSEQFDHKSE